MLCLKCEYKDEQKHSLLCVLQKRDALCCIQEIIIIVGIYTVTEQAQWDSEHKTISTTLISTAVFLSNCLCA